MDSASSANSAGGEGPPISLFIRVVSLIFCLIMMVVVCLHVYRRRAVQLRSMAPKRMLCEGDVIDHFHLGYKETGTVPEVTGVWSGPVKASNVSARNDKTPMLQIVGTNGSHGMAAAI